MRSTRFVTCLIAFAATCATAACTGILGSYEVGVPTEAGASEGGANEGGPIDEGGAGDTSVPTDGATDAGCVSPKMFCGSACVDLETDKDNCGACGRSCLGGGCTAHTCSPFLIFPRMDVAVSTLVATDTDLFFGTSVHDVIQQPVSGAAPIKLGTPPGQVFSIATLGSRAFFTAAAGTGWQLWEASIGMPTSALTRNPIVPGTQVGLVAVAAAGNVHTLTTPPSPPTEVFQFTTCPGDGSGCFSNYSGMQRPGSRIVAGNGFVFWTDQYGKVYETADAVGILNTVSAAEGTATAAAWDGTTLFWVNINLPNIRRSPYPMPAASTVRDLGMASGPDDMLVDTTNLYYSQSNSSASSDLWAIPKAGPATVPAIHLAVGTIGRIAQTASGIYWAESDGIHVIRKP